MSTTPFDTTHANGHPSFASTPDQLPGGLWPPAEAAHQALPAGPDDLRWELAYDRASVDRFVERVEAERVRLQAELDAARARTERARSAASARHGEALAELGALALAAQRELAELEREHREIIEAIRAAAAEEAARLLEAAREQAAAVQAAAASLDASMLWEGPAGWPSTNDANPSARVDHGRDAR